MQIDFKLVSAGLATFVAVDAYVIRRQRKMLNARSESIVKLADLSQYLVDVLDHHDVPFTQFDSIALNTIMKD